MEILRQSGMYETLYIKAYSINLKWLQNAVHQPYAWKFYVR